MTEPANERLTAGPQSPSAWPDLLDRLERQLAEQLSLAKNDELEAALIAAGRIDELLAEARGASEAPSSGQISRLAGVLKLHRDIGLVLAQRRDDVARELRRGARGKRTLTAYRQTTGPWHVRGR